MGVCCAGGNIDEEVVGAKNLAELVNVMNKRDLLYEEEQREIKYYIEGKIDRVTIINLDGLTNDILKKRIQSLEYLRLYNKKLINIYNSANKINLEKAKNGVETLYELYSRSYAEKDEYESIFKKIENYLNN